MKYVTPLLISFSLLAFAAQAADDAKKNQSKQPTASSQGAAKPSTSGSASAGASGAKAKSSAKMDFDKLDTNKDGQLSRAEFEAMHKSGASTGKTSSPAKSSTGASGGASASGSAGTAGSASTGKAAK
jgi:hypothetical protein